MQDDIKQSFLWIPAIVLVSGGLGCNTDVSKVTDSLQKTNVAGVAQDLASQCGLTCPKEGISKGNAAISGLASVDAFFGAVISYGRTAQSVSGGIEAQLDAIKADFGIAADADLQSQLSAQIAAYVDGDVTAQAEPAQCFIDTKALLQAEAACDSKIDPDHDMVACKGTCDGMAAADVRCESGSELHCTMAAASASCMGECQGSCVAQLSAAANCDGVCDGMCSGSCSAYVKNAAGDLRCHGTCAGQCNGACSTELATQTQCMGQCDGQCTVVAQTSCSGDAHVSCKAKEGASVMCNGRCRGDCDAPKAKAECEASAKAQAQLHVQCTPPRVVFQYKLASVNDSDTEGQTRFVAGLRKLEGHLPALLAAIAHANSVSSAGELLSTSATGAVKASFKAATSGKLTAKESVGLGCAVGELDSVADIISSSSERMMTDLKTCSDVKAMLGIQG